MTATPPDLIAACVSGDLEARATFQQVYGPLIYTFPVRIFHLSADEAGDFYLYVFDKERVFKRISSFEGRNAIQFETYLSYFVLRDLFLEWVRTREQVVTVPLDVPITDSQSESGRTRTDILPAETPTPDTVLVAADDMQRIEHAINQLDEEKKLVLKLLALDTIDLEPEDIRSIARLASRSIRETLQCIDAVKDALAAKSMKAREKRDTIHSVAYWIHTYQRQMASLTARIHVSRQQGDTEIEHRLAQEHAELERKLVWRYEQQARLQEELRTFNVRPSYKDMATILNVPLGTMSSRIARAREEFGQRLAAAR